MIASRTAQTISRNSHREKFALNLVGAITLNFIKHLEICADLRNHYVWIMMLNLNGKGFTTGDALIRRIHLVATKRSMVMSGSKKIQIIIDTRSEKIW